MLPSHEVINMHMVYHQIFQVHLITYLKLTCSCSVTAFIPSISCKAKLDTNILFNLGVYMQNTKEKVSSIETIAVTGKKCLFYIW